MISIRIPYDNPPSAIPSRLRRRGVTFTELIAALMMLGVLLTLSVSVLGAVARERRSAEQRQFALQHAANLLEQISSTNWAQISLGPQTIEPAPADLLSVLPDLERHVEVTELKQEYHCKLVTVTLQWKGVHGQMIVPVRLFGWVYPLGERS